MKVNNPVSFELLNATNEYLKYHPYATLQQVDEFIAETRKKMSCVQENEK